ncbi:MAG: hypothetical protein QOJ40_2041, partial [Verrucomicrobiota bacterium]
MAATFGIGNAFQSGRNAAAACDAAVENCCPAKRPTQMGLAGLSGRFMPAKRPPHLFLRFPSTPTHVEYLIALFLFVVVMHSHGQTVDLPSLSFSQVATNTFKAPIKLTHAGDGSGRLFVLEQGGRIWIVQSNNLVTPPFLDLAGRGDVQALLSAAFPPGFATNNHFYACYTRNSDGAACLSRFQIGTNANIADTNSEQVLLVLDGSYGYDVLKQIAFGPDGFLYVGLGDGGNLSAPQNTSSLPGKLLRVDVESGAAPYSVPANNPFIGNTNYAAEIWALGLRNPGAFSFDRNTGDLYLEDSGYTYQEINYQTGFSAGGQNYGWPIMDGPAAFSPP